MKVEDEVKKLLDEAVKNMSGGGDAPSQQVIDQMLSLLARLAVTCQHLGHRIDQLNGQVAELQRSGAS